MRVFHNTLQIFSLNELSQRPVLFYFVVLQDWPWSYWYWQLSFCRSISPMYTHLQRHGQKRIWQKAGPYWMTIVSLNLGIAYYSLTIIIIKCVGYRWTNHIHSYLFEEIAAAVANLRDKRPFIRGSPKFEKRPFIRGNPKLINKKNDKKAGKS